MIIYYYEWTVKELPLQITLHHIPNDKLGNNLFMKDFLYTVLFNE
jgi:hypothetical protein